MGVHRGDVSRPGVDHRSMDVQRGGVSRPGVDHRLYTGVYGCTQGKRHGDVQSCMMYSLWPMTGPHDVWSMAYVRSA